MKILVASGEVRPRQDELPSNSCFVRKPYGAAGKINETMPVDPAITKETPIDRARASALSDMDDSPTVLNARRRRPLRPPVPVSSRDEASRRRDEMSTISEHRQGSVAP